ncbi:biotin--[acetyl-CoA-carboxylase] ligase [candidate division WOR-1 bacterium RIFOXYD2_FULL_36_8]|uniref:Biotin--[acetyl-CoA-carboxylase] ligase n=1 Tax=candidate division WOR-1 bacterium RIFOXYB2_FULL_36_35 TaxID=1802578 RepID=A0A1F4S5Q2_UNCSA|nr:MAG: biotin--[acetyl-CoA-carboxylase] ligase [candidate division WOR-1 bacterium RIFOXYA2_FULL_36_21]OGC15766.1 MAG: biotin--[acetyl-CoA-carboxylase] ligase [candidate division WOR-1 bacterium RIFOXYB2_FULL_36_35]OGC21121.1 MAG: biotin--[acetyl-CoA-carboxylase] ligase [candidate division WOR-1 bacterium RIFOXYA12_FULL_36_13]OGC39032.1 MAG: biotin--[acetyl-CoA-carboxylase] ligase [candidate division WOR-1 bacterium RIFOXYD2_FULL_36_8]
MNYNIIKLKILDSTQDEAKRKAFKVDEGTVVWAEKQTMGRGKPGNKWYSPSGGLYFSLILKPTKPVKDILFITKLVADVVVDLLSKYNITAEIKLPNDVFVANMKICGILTEKTKEGLIIGVGINLNILSFPEGFLATSVTLLTGKEIDPEIFLNQFLELFDLAYCH